MPRIVYITLFTLFTSLSFGQTTEEDDVVSTAYEIIYVNQVKLDKKVFLQHANLYYYEEENAFLLEGLTDKQTIGKCLFEYSHTENGRDYYEFYDNDYEYIDDVENGVLLFRSIPKKIKDSENTMYREIRLEADKAK